MKKKDAELHSQALFLDIWNFHLYSHVETGFTVLFLPSAILSERSEWTAIPSVSNWLLYYHSPFPNSNSSPFSKIPALVFHHSYTQLTKPRAVLTVKEYTFTISKKTVITRENIKTVAGHLFYLKNYYIFTWRIITFSLVSYHGMKLRIHWSCCYLKNLQRIHQFLSRAISPFQKGLAVC